MWVAIIAFGLPEIFAGTGKGWLTRPDVYILGLPLYALHFLLLIHIAVRTQRTSWPALYIFGVLFSLYETWITKVVWNGYPGSEGFAMGGAIGNWFGVHETFGLLLFYHPVTSFLLPVAVISRLIPAFGRHFPVPDWLFGKTRTGLFVRIGLLAIWGTASGHNMPVLSEYLISWIPMLGLIWLGYFILNKNGVTGIASEKANIVASPVMGRWALIIASIWLAAIYFVSYNYLLPEKLPPTYVQLITLAFYPILALIIASTPKRAKVCAEREPPANPAKMPIQWLLAVFFLGIIATFIIAQGEVFRISLVLTSFVMMVPIGIWLFFWMVLWKSVIRRSQATSSSSS